MGDIARLEWELVLLITLVAEEGLEGREVQRQVKYGAARVEAVFNLLCDE